MAGWRYKISATIFCKFRGSQGLSGRNLTAQFLWHSCPQLLSSPVFIRWSNIKWYFCCLSWGIFKKLATDPLQMQHRGNETNIKMLVYFQEFNLKKLRRLKNNVDMLNRGRYICIFSCFNGTKITKWVQHGADKVFFIIIDSQYNPILFTNILVLWILMKFSPVPRSSSSHQPGLIRKKCSWRVVFCVPRNVFGLVLVTARTQSQSWLPIIRALSPQTRAGDSR